MSKNVLKIRDAQSYFRPNTEKAKTKNSIHFRKFVRNLKELERSTLDLFQRPNFIESNNANEDKFVLQTKINEHL